MSFFGRESEKQVFSLMDGVPVKISEQFKPPRKVRLPAGYQQRLLTETTIEEYEFTLERNVIQKMGEWRRVRKAAEEKRKERIRLNDAVQKSDKTSPDKKQSQPLAVSSKNLSAPVSPVPISISAPNTVLSSSHTITKGVTSFNIHNDSILTPMQIVQPAIEVETSQISYFNFSDFEADTSSPFDNMELKTINEMEVLAHVLQPLSSSPDNNINSSLSNYIIGKNANSGPPSGKEGDVPENKLPVYGVYDGSAEGRDNKFAPPCNQVAYDYEPSYSSQNHYDFYPNQAWPVGEVNPGGDNKSVDPHNIPIQNLNVTSIINDPSQVTYSANKHFHSESIPIKQFTQTTTNTQDTGNHYSNHLINSKFSSVDGSPEYYSPSFPPSNQGTDKSSHLKSVPEIVQDLEKDLRWKAMERNRESPIPHGYGSSGRETYKQWPNPGTSPENLRPCLKKPSSTTKAGPSSPSPVSKLPNPYNELSTSARKLVKHISDDMGFNLARVARACVSVGPDNKKIIEYLLQIQSLENEKYSGDAVERALEASHFDRSKTIVHLEAMNKLLSLGFEEENIFDALVRCDNDLVKALDYLIL